jgi:4-hydroxy-tetrahydrodipicolinate reductase
MTEEKTKVIVTGAAGKVGREIAAAILKEKDLDLVGAVDIVHTGRDLGDLMGKKEFGIKIEADLYEVIKKTQAEVMVDFTHSQAAMKNARTAIFNGVIPIIGTTGFSDEEIQTLRNWCEQNDTGAFLCPNFAIGAVLMMQMAKMAAKYFNDVEIIELHHDGKIDAPSGTSIQTAELINLERRLSLEEQKIETEDSTRARGGNWNGVRIHSVRLPGLLAHHEVIFGTEGQTLSIRHDSISRVSFIPGVILAIKKIKSLKGLLIGLEKLIDI